MEVKVSIVVPVYNVEQYIAQSLDSFVNQTLTEIEIILVDDCSTDQSGNICEEYASHDNRITVVHNERNIRQGLSRNKGIELAKGEYIAFFDPDDWVDLDFIEKLYVKAKKSRADIVKAQPIKVFPDGQRKVQSVLNRQIKRGLKRKKPIYLLFTYEHFSALYKREIIMSNNIRYPDIRNAEDNVFLLIVTYFSKNMMLTHGTYYYYRQHNQSTIAEKSKPYYFSVLQYVKLYFDFINSHELSKSNYDLAVIRVFNSISDACNELDRSNLGEDFKRNYMKEIFKIIQLYKYDQSFLFNGMMQGLYVSMSKEGILKSKAYKLLFKIFN